MKDNRGFASTFILFGLLSLFLIVMSILLFTMNNSSVLNSGLKSKAVTDIETKMDKDLGEISVSLGLNGGSLNNAQGWQAVTVNNEVLYKKILNYDSSYNDLPVPTKQGYVISGWNTKADGTGLTYKPSTEYTFKHSVTLYAQWEIKGVWVNYTFPHTLYNWYNLSSSDAYNTGINIDWDHDFELSARYWLPNSNQSYVLMGTSSSDKGLEIWVDNSNNKVVIYMGGHQVYTSATAIESGKAIRIFFTWYANNKSWNFQIQGQDVAMNGNSVYNISGKSGGTLYIGSNARNYYPIKADYVSYKTKYTYGETQTRVPTPAKTGYTWKGWSTNQSTYTAANLTTTTAVPENDTTYYGFWDANSIWVTYQISPSGTWRSIDNTSHRLFIPDITLDWDMHFTFSIKAYIPNKSISHWIAGMESGGSNRFGLYQYTDGKIYFQINDSNVAVTTTTITNNVQFQIWFTWNPDTKTYTFKTGGTNMNFEKSGTLNISGTSKTMYIGSTGSGLPNPMYVDYVSYSIRYKYDLNETQEYLPNPEFENYTFRGFSTTESTYTAANLTTSTPVSASNNTTYYGYWQ